MSDCVGPEVEEACAKPAGKSMDIMNHHMLFNYHSLCMHS